jgi:peptide/nickel transport system substrate-binding protein
MPSLLRKPRTIIWFVRSFIAKKKKFIFFGFIFSLLVCLYWYSGFFLSVRGIFIPENSVGIVGKYNLTNLPLLVQNKISIGLTKITSDDRATSSAAISWEISDEGKTYIFKLDPNLKWHDNAKFKSFDVNYRLKGVEIIALGDLAIQLKLKEPFASLPYILSQPLFKNKLIGLGSYRVVDIRWNGDTISSIDLINTKNSSDRIIYKFYLTENEAFTALRLKKISRIEGITNINNIKRVSDFNITSLSNYYSFVALFFNTAKEPFSDKQTRLGLTYAIPNEILTGQEETQGPIPKTSWFYNSNLKEYSINIDQTKKYLKNILEKKENESTLSSELQISLETLSLYKPMAEMIAKAWNDLGIKTKIIEKNVVSNNYDVFLGALETKSDPDQYYLWHSTQTNGSNISNLKNPRIDKILEDGRKIIDQEERKAKYQEFQKFLVEELPAVFFFYQKTYSVTRL